MNNNQPNLMAKLISRKQKQNQSTIKTTAEDNKNVSAAAINNDKQKNCKLLKIHQIPSHLRFNKYVLTHYRPTTNFIGCLKSLFYLHNETVNILTHGKYHYNLLILTFLYFEFDNAKFFTKRV